MRLSLNRLPLPAAGLAARWAGAQSVLHGAWLFVLRALGSRQALVALLVIVPMLLAGLLGYAIALGSNLLTLLAAAIIIGPLLLFIPSRALVVVLFAITYFGAGLAMYYGKINQAHWVPYVVCMWLWMKLPMDALARRRQMGFAAERASLSAPMVVLCALMLVCLLTTALNTTPILSFLVGAKNYLFVWSLTFAVAGGLFNEADLRRVWLAMLWVAVLQMPFTVLQHFMAFAKTANWDTVVGSFGGNPEGAGQSGAMVIYVSIALALVMALWRWGQIRAPSALAAAGCILVAVAMAEVKAFFILAPLGLAIVLLREVRSRPAVGLAALVVCALATASMFAYYKQAYFDDSRSVAQSDTANDYVDYILSSDSKLDLVNWTTGEVSRFGAPLLWDREVAKFGVDRRWLGFGLRASRMGGLIGAGEAARHFQFSLTTSTLTAMLWDVGALGLICMLALLCTTGGAAWRLSANDRAPPFHRACLEATASGSVVLLAACVYNDAVIDHFTTQVLLAFMVGYVVYWHRALTTRVTKPKARA